MSSSATYGCSTYPPISNHALQQKGENEGSIDGIFNQGDIWISNIQTPPVSIYEEVCSNIVVAEECCSSSNCNYYTIQSSVNNHQAQHLTQKQPTKFDIFTPKETVPLNEIPVSFTNDDFITDDQDVELIDDHCGNCYKRFKTTTDLLHHCRKSEHEADKCQKRLTSCSMPQQIVKRKQPHFNQKLTKGGFRSDQCCHCRKKFKTPTDFAFHRCKKKHKVDKWKKHSSLSNQIDQLPLKKKESRSNLKFTSKQQLLVQTGKQQYKCSECGKVFKQELFLKRHILLHTGLRPFKCTYCEKSFAHQGTLKVHIRSHTGERPYKCSECGKSFAQHCTLKYHMFIHTGERPYKCVHCDKAFRQLGALKSHVKMHTRGRKKKKL